MRRLLATAILGIALLAAGSAPGSTLPPGSDPALAQWPAWPFPVSCGGPAFDPSRVFSGPAEAENGTLESEAALRGVLADPSLAWLGLSPSGWRLAGDTGTEAAFVNGFLGRGLESVRLSHASGAWKLLGSGTCQLRSALADHFVVGWRLVPEQRALTAETRAVRITVGAGPCNSGRPYVTRPPVFRQVGTRLLMILSIEPPGGGFQTCQGIAQPPFTVRLPGRLGSRKLYDGSVFPPPSAAETREPAFYSASRSARLRQ